MFGKQDNEGFSILFFQRQHINFDLSESSIRRITWKSTLKVKYIEKNLMGALSKRKGLGNVHICLYQLVHILSKQKFKLGVWFMIAHLYRQTDIIQRPFNI